jgi:hypothetical protein
VSNSEKRRERERLRRVEQARLAELEDDLKAAQKIVADLEAHVDAPVSRDDAEVLKRASFDPTAVGRFLGAPALLELTRRFEGVLPRHQFEQLVDRLREITHEPGIVEIREESVVWATSPQRHAGQPHLVVRVTVASNETNLVVTDRLGALIGRVFGAFGTIVGAGGLGAPVAASIAFPLFTPVFILGWLGSVFGTTRVVFRRLAAGRARQLHRTFGTLVLEIEPYLKPAKNQP